MKIKRISSHIFYFSYSLSFALSNLSYLIKLEICYVSNTGFIFARIIEVPYKTPLCV